MYLNLQMEVSSWTQLTDSGGSTYQNMHVDQHNYEFIDGNKVIYLK